VLALADPRFDHVETDRVLAAAAGDPDEGVRLAAALGAGVRGRASEAQHVLLARTTARAGLLPPYPGSGKRGHTNLRAAGRLRSPEAGAAWPALRSAGAPATLQALRAAWQGAEERECVVLLRAFTAIGETGVADIRARLDDPSRVVRREAALCLATLGDTGAPALPVLVDLLSDEADAGDQPEDHYGRADAAVVAALVARMPGALPPLVAALEAYAASPDDRVRPPPRHVLEVLEAAGEKAAPAAVAVARVIVETPFAYPGADAGSWNHPADALDALRALGAPVTHALAARLLDADRDVRWRARHALGDLGKSATPALDALDRAAASGPEAEREQYAALARSIRGQP